MQPRKAIRGIRCNNAGDDRSRDSAAGSGARSRRDRRRSGRGLRRDRAAHPRAAGAGTLRSARLHHLAARRSPAIPKRCSPVRAASSRPPSATTRPSRRARRATAGCRATRATTATRKLREKLERLGGELGAPYRVLVDSNDHVDREAGRPLRGRLLRQEHDADHAPSTAPGSSSGRS